MGMGEERQEVLSWNDVDGLIDHLLPQLRGVFDALLMITRGGMVPGGLVAEALGIETVLTAAVRFTPTTRKLLSWPTFLQFPTDDLLTGKRILVIDDVWKSGRTIVSVKARVEQVGGHPELAVLHYKPTQSLFPNDAPHYYAALTDAFIIYPWEARRRPDGVPVGPLVPQVG